MPCRFIRGVVLAFLLATLMLLSGVANAEIRLASFNIQHLGYNNGKDIRAVAAILSRFDLVAVQEVMNKPVIDKIEKQLEARTGESWSSITSDPAGRTSRYQEHYAFIWRDSVVDFEGSAVP